MFYFLGSINDYTREETVEALKNYSKLSSDEIIKTGMWGESSQFIRLNNSKVRQTGIIDDISYSISLISNKRQISQSLTITGDFKTDTDKLLSILNNLKKDIVHLPEDPFIIYPSGSKSSKEKFKGELLPFENAIDSLLKTL